MPPLRLLALLTCLVGPAWTRAADAQPDEPRYALPRPADLTPEQQERILKTFAAAAAPLRTFMKHFPSATFSMVRPNAKEAHIIIATTLELGRYTLSLVYSGTFDAEFKKLQGAQCDLFCAYDEIHQSAQPNRRRKPLLLRLADMDEFCREPQEYLARQFEAAP